MKKFFGILVTSLLMFCMIISCTNDAGETMEKVSPSIKGRVILDEASGLKPEDIFFTISGLEGEHRVESDGSWKVTGLEENKSYTLYFKSQKQTRGLDDISEWGAKLIDVIARSGEDLLDYLATITRTWEIKGKVLLSGVDAAEGLGMSGTTVFVPGTGYIAMTDKDGYYSIKGVPAGKDYSLIFNHDGFAGVESDKFELKSKTPGKERIKDMGTDNLVKDKGYLYGKVILEDYPGHSFSSDTVYASKDGENTGMYPISRDGNYNISGVRNGSYVVHFNIRQTDGSVVSYERNVSVTDGTSVRCDLVIKSVKGSVFGILHDNDDRPIVGAEISIDENNVKSDEKGFFKLPDIMPGEYVLSIRKDGFSNYETKLVISQSGNVDLSVIKLDADISNGDFRVRKVGNDLEIIGYTGKATNLSIPDNFNGKTVVSIGRSAFGSNGKLVSVTIPDTVTTIKSGAFKKCSALQSVKLGTGVKDIEGWAFHDCINLNSIEWNTGLEIIGEQAFRNCEKLKTVTMPSSVRQLGKAIFWNCTALEKVSISENVKEIPAGLFDGCTKLSTITMAPDITKIGTNAFRCCPISGTFVIPQTVTFVGSWAFEKTKLSKIIIHNTKEYVDANWAKDWNNAVAEVIYSQDGDRVPVSGKIELNIIGDVLIPEPLVVDVFIDGEKLTSFRCSYDQHVFNLEKSGYLDCVIRGVEGYDYYLETEKKADRTVILIVIDREIENPGYMDIDFTQKFILGDNMSRGLFLKADNTVFPGEDMFRNAGYIYCSNYVKHRTIKVEPDTYTSYQNLGSNTPSCWILEMKQGSAYVSAGEKVNLEMTSIPYSTVTATLPGLSDGRTVWIESSDYSFNTRKLAVTDGECKFDCMPGTYRIYSATDDGGEPAYYILDSVDILSGENIISFKPLSSKVIDTGLTVGNGELVYLNFDIRSSIPMISKIYVGSDTYMEPYFLYQNTRAYFEKGGKVRLFAAVLDDYDITTSVSTMKGGYKCLNVTIDLPKDKGCPVSLIYDFTFEDLPHRNRYPIFYDAEGTRYIVSTKNARNTINIPEGNYNVGNSYRYQDGETRKYDNNVVIDGRCFSINKNALNELHIICK